MLDVNLRGEMIFPVAEKLKALGVLTVFCTGYADLRHIPEPLRDEVRLSKPCAAASVEAALRTQMAESGLGLIRRVWSGGDRQARAGVAQTASVVFA
ncbi:hypothetical protein [Caulobacter sp. S45]|uniref:hypothetical protein n=1 Tax=Caulobacter sp. S45 TaxID=1641861 RepID=UPI00157696D3|nr:hypothetical protein [Caulobacter sp. S45]